jgi:hypothetical protein
VPKLLFLNPQADASGGGSVSGAHWVLHDKTDVDSLRVQLEQAINDRTAISVRVMLPGSADLMTVLTVNGGLLGSVAVIEAGPPPEPVPEPSARGVRAS